MAHAALDGGSRAFGRRSGTARPTAETDGAPELGTEPLELFPCALGPREVAERFRFVELLFELGAPRRVRFTRAGVEMLAGVARVHGLLGGAG